jgi:hypothetical protein
MELKVKRLGEDWFSRPLLKNIETGAIYCNTDLVDDLTSEEWCTTSSDGEPDCPLRKDKKFVLVES